MMLAFQSVTRIRGCQAVCADRLQRGFHAACTLVRRT